MRTSIGLAVLAIVGCGDSTAAPDAPKHADAAPDSGPVETWTGTVEDFQSGSAIANASVCILANGTIPCSTSDGSGTWTLEIPEPSGSENLAVLTTADGYDGSVLLAASTPAAFEYPATILLQADPVAASELGSDAGFAYPGLTNGFIEVDVFGTVTGQAPPGATVAISPSSGTGPVYADADNTPDPR